MSSPKIDYVVIGQGLAGTVFAWQAIMRGKRVLILDKEEAITSSKIAAGIVNPFIGPRIAKSWRFDELWPVARRFYQSCEREHLKSCFWWEAPSIRLFSDEEQAKRYPEGSAALPENFDLEAFDAQFGGFQATPAGRLDVAGFLRRSREVFLDLGVYRHIAGAGYNSQTTVYCEGFAGSKNPLFKWIPLRPSKGEILDLKIPNLYEERIVNRGKWLLPLGGENFQAGSTFTWDDDLSCAPTSQGRAEIESGLREMVRLDFEVTGAKAAIRPMPFRGKPRLGRHPEKREFAYFNGLGSKGVLLAPFFAQQLLAHLEDKAPLDTDVDISQYWRS